MSTLTGMCILLKLFMAYNMIYGVHLQRKNCPFHTFGHFLPEENNENRNRKLFLFVLTGYDSLFDFPIEEEEDDPDILEDPIYDMDIQVNT